jgi:hypothetical protein
MEEAGFSQSAFGLREVTFVTLPPEIPNPDDAGFASRQVFLFPHPC